MANHRAKKPTNRLDLENRQINKDMATRRKMLRITGISVIEWEMGKS